MNSDHDQHDGNTGDEADLRAAEYVLGLLDAAGHRQAQALIESDAAFAAEVLRWEDYFAPWLEAIPPVPVPPALWQRIRETLWGHELPQRDQASAIASRKPLSQSLPFWRGLALGGAAVAVASIALLLTNYSVPAPAPTPPQVVTTTPTVAPAAAEPMIVSLRHEDGTTAYTATLNPDDGTVVLVPVHLGGDQATSPELWLIPAGQSPRSLGMIKRDEPMVMTIPTALRSSADTGTFAITLEPQGSGPHEAPTGPVIATGTSIRLAP